MTGQSFRGAKDRDSALLFHRTAWASDTDMLGHVNNAVYVSWIQDVGVAHWNALADEDLQARHAWVCLRHEVDYREPVYMGETVEILTWLGKHRGPRFDRHVEIKKPDTDRWSVQAVTTWCLIDRVTGRPAKVSGEIFDIFGLNPEDHK